MRYRERETGHVSEIEVDRPQLVADYAEYAGKTDRHNQLRQGSLGIERAFRASSGHHRISCTIIGMDVTDTYNACKYHLTESDPINSSRPRKMGIR